MGSHQGRQAGAAPDDAVLVEKLKTNRSFSEAFLQLDQKYKQKLIAYVRQRVPTDADSEEVYYQALEKACLRIHNLEDPAKFKAWLYRIAHNEAMQWYRDHQRSLSDEVFLDPVQWEQRQGEDPRTSREPDQARGNSIETECLEAAWHALTLTEQETLWYTVVFPEDTTQSLAAHRDIREAAVRQRKKRALEKLKRLFDDLKKRRESEVS